MADAKKRNFTQFLLLFLVIYIGTQLLFGTFFPQGEQTLPTPGPVITASSAYTVGNSPILHVENRPVTSESHGIAGWFRSTWCGLQSFFQDDSCAALAATHTGPTVTIKNRCPQPPVDVYSVTLGGKRGEKMAPEKAPSPCENIEPIGPGESVEITLSPWKDELFPSVGTYEVALPPGTINLADYGPSASGAEIQAQTVTRFSIKEPGVFTKLFRTFITAPFLNFLVLVASVTPGYNLGLAIIVLTLLVKLLLFIPTQHAMEGQKKMQLLQPKLEELKKRYKDDPKRQQEETMKLWKEHKINPFQSCLPMLIQFPILIGLFYVIRDGSHLASSQHLLYAPYENLPWTFGTNFLWMDLLKPDFYVMPVLLVLMQFLQMKFAFAIQKRKKKSKDIIDVGDKAKEPASAQDMQQKMMLYGLPLMIGVFAFQFPAAVALYWGVSTLFGIGQQLIVNREHLRV